MARPREFDIDEALDAAIGAFRARGYEATSMADLMEAMGLQKGSIYKAFGDKHQLFLSALDRYLAAACEETRQVLAGGPSPREGIRRWLQCAVLPNCCQKRLHGCFGVNSLVELGPHDEESARRLNEHFDACEGLLAEAISRGQRAGELRRDREAEELAEVLMVFVTGMLARSRCKRTRARVERLSAEALAMLE